MSSKVYFDQIATEWDDIRQGYFSENVREVALQTAVVQAGHLAGDIGAGSGFISEALLKAGLKVIAVDQSEEMLMELKRRFPDVETRAGEAEHLPIAENTLNYAFANMFLHHVENPAATILDMARTLQPGGKLVITDLDEHKYEFLRTEQHDRWLGFQREAVKAWFEAAGLQNVVVDCVGGNCCADSACGSASAQISIFVASGAKRS